MAQLPQTEQSSFIDNVLHTVGLKIFSFAFGIAMYTTFVALLGPEKLGRYSLMVATFTILWGLSQLGVARVNYYMRVKGVKADVLVIQSAILAFLLSAIFLGVFAIILPHITPYLFNKIPSQSWYYILWGMPFACTAIAFNYILLAEDQIRYLNWIEFIKQGLQLLICTGLFFVTDYFNYIVFIFPIPFVIETVFYLIKLGRMGRLGWILPDRKLVKESIIYGLKSQVAMTEILVGTADKYFIKFFLGADGDYWVGIYAVAQWFIQKLRTFFILIINNLFSYLSQKDREAGLAITVKAARYVWFISLAALCNFVLLGYPLILLLFGAKYTGSYPSLLLLSSGMIFTSMVLTFNVSYLKSGKPLIPTYAALITSGANVVLNFILVPLMGIEGTALATALSYFLAMIFIVTHFRRYEKYLPLTHLIFPQPGDYQVYQRTYAKVKGGVFGIFSRKKG